MRIAPSGRFCREAREPDQHHRSIWLLASPHCPDIQNRQNLGRLGCLSVISLVSDLVRRVSSRWKGTGFYWPADSAGAVYINEECQGEIPMRRLRRLRAQRISLGFGHRSDFEFRLPIPNWNPIDRMLGKLDPKPEFRDKMTGFRKARRF